MNLNQLDAIGARKCAMSFKYFYFSLMRSHVCHHVDTNWQLLRVCVCSCKKRLLTLRSGDKRMNVLLNRNSKRNISKNSIQIARAFNES